MKFLELKKSLQSNIDPLYVLSGVDDYLVQKAIQQFAEACGNDCPEMDHSFFTEENWNISAVLASLSALPLLSQKRLVYVNIAGKIPAGDLEKLKDYFANPNPLTCLAIRKTDAFSNLKEGTLVDCKPLDGVVLSKLVVSELEKANKTITHDAVQLLLEYCSFNLSRVMPELKKLASYHGEITSTLISEVVVPDVDFEIFALTNALSERNGDKCFQILSELLQRKEDVQAIFGLISGHFRRIIFSSFSSQMTTGEIAGLLGVKDFAISKAKTLAKAYTQKQLKSILELLVNVDFAIKNGDMQAETALYFLISSILQT